MSQIELQLNSANRTVPMFQYQKGEGFDYQTVIDRIDAGPPTNVFDGIDALHMINWIVASFKNSKPDIFEHAQRLAAYTLQHTTGMARTQLKMGLINNLGTYTNTHPHIEPKYWIPVFNKSFSTNLDVQIALIIAEHHALKNFEDVYPEDSITKPEVAAFLALLHSAVECRKTNVYDTNKLHHRILKYLKAQDVGIFELEYLQREKEYDSEKPESVISNNPFIKTLPASTIEVIGKYASKSIPVGYIQYFKRVLDSFYEIQKQQTLGPPIDFNIFSDQ